MTSQAVRLRRAIEAYHACSYFAPETRTTYTDALGLHYWHSYFGSRSAPMGAVGPEVVTATFFSFSARLVARALPSVWDSISPEGAIADRLAGVDRALLRILGPALDGPEIEEALELARAAVAACDFSGRPLAAATASIPEQGRPHLRLWQHLSTLREFRGDGHVAGLVLAGIGPIAAVVTSAGFADFPPGSYKKLRGWTDEQWEAGVAATVEQGWVTPELELTDAGRSLREQVEEQTDKSVAAPLTAIGADGVQRLIEIVKPLSKTIFTSGGIG